MKIDEKIDRGFYITGWCLIAVAVCYTLFTKLTGIHLLQYLPPCALHQLTGLFCPGCGGSRSVLALLQGHLLQSLWWHPFVPYVAVLGSVFMITQTMQRCSRNRWKIGMHFRSIYLWIGLGIILFNVIWKNALLLSH